MFQRKIVNGKPRKRVGSRFIEFLVCQLPAVLVKKNCVLFVGLLVILCVFQLKLTHPSSQLKWNVDGGSSLAQQQSLIELIPLNESD